MFLLRLTEHGYWICIRGGGGGSTSSKGCRTKNKTSDPLIKFFSSYESRALHLRNKDGVDSIIGTPQTRWSYKKVLSEGVLWALFFKLVSSTFLFRIVSFGVLMIESIRSFSTAYYYELLEPGPQGTPGGESAIKKSQSNKQQLTFASSPQGWFIFMIIRMFGYFFGGFQAGAADPANESSCELHFKNMCCGGACGLNCL